MTTGSVNLILAGDRPDPTVLKDGDDYYLTYSSLEAHPDCRYGIRETSSAGSRSDSPCPTRRPPCSPAT